LGYFEEADNCNLYAGPYYDSLLNIKANFVSSGRNECAWRNSHFY